MSNNKSELRQALSRLVKDKFAAASLFILCAFFAAGLCGEIYSVVCSQSEITPVYDRGDIANSYQAPSWKNWLGTDYKGRDVMLRATAAIRTAVKIGVTASLISVLLGVALGALSGYYGKLVDDIIVWLYSVFAAMPTLLFVLAFSLLVTKGFLFPPLAKGFAAFSGLLHMEPGMMALYIGIGLTGWVGICRVVRAEAMRIREMAYIRSARALGYHDLRIIFVHLLPNLMHLVIIYFTLRFAYAVMTEVIVSYLGLGVQLEPSWGVMIADGQQRLWRGVWWEVAGATGFMFVFVLALNILGDALRDALDPRLKK